MTTCCKREVQISQLCLKTCAVLEVSRVSERMKISLESRLVPQCIIILIRSSGHLRGLQDMCGFSPQLP